MENSQLLEYIGETKTKNLVDDIQKEYFEILKKTFTEKADPIHNINANSLIIVHEKNADEIKSIGMSCINDLINDNFGLFFGAILSRGGSVNLLDTSGVIKNVIIYGQSNNFGDTNGAPPAVHNLGCQFAIGSGVSPPLRNDFVVENIIGGNFNPSGNAGYNSGLSQITVTGLSPVLSGTGSIGNTVIMGKWFSIPSISRLHVLSHDLISPVVNFINGQVATIEYTWQL